MAYIILLRHGKSEWNLENKFTGWYDADIASKGIKEAKLAGKLIKKTKINFDKCYTSWLRRAVKTLWHSLEVSGNFHLSVCTDWRLNERHYGALTGLNKDEVIAKYGIEQVKIWRRSFDIPPPLCDENSEYHPKNLKNYKFLNQTHSVCGESLSQTIDRVTPVYNQFFLDDFLKNKNLIVSSHGNTIRSLIKLFFNITNEDIVKVEIPTANPLLISFENGKFSSYEFLDKDRATIIPINI